MIAGNTLKLHIKQEASSLLSSPIGVFVAAVAFYSIGLSASVYISETLLLPVLFSALMFPVLLSATLHLPLHNTSIQDFLNSRNGQPVEPSRFHA